MIKDGGPAFPRPVGNSGTSSAVYSQSQQGMSLRQYYAGQALSGLLANPNYSPYTRSLAFDSYSYADAMIKKEEEDIDDDSKNTSQTS